MNAPVASARLKPDYSWAVASLDALLGRVFAELAPPLPLSWLASGLPTRSRSS